METTKPINPYLDLIPGELLVDRSWRAWGVQSLAWDYIETILDVAAQHRLQEFKALCRLLRKMKYEYDHFRQYVIPIQILKDEDERGIDYEDAIKSDLRKAVFAVDFALMKDRVARDVLPEALLRAVLEAWLVMCALEKYAEKVDGELKAYWEECPKLVCLFDPTVDAIPLVGKFLRGYENRVKPIIEMNAGILMNRIVTADYFNIPQEGDKLPTE